MDHLGGVKRSKIIKFQFIDFLYQTLCVYSQIKDKKTYPTGYLFCLLCHVLGMALGDAGVDRGSIIFSNTAMWHIESTGLMS